MFGDPVMNVRIKSVILFGFVLPILVLGLILVSSLELYQHIREVWKTRQDIVRQDAVLESKIQSSIQQKRLIDTLLDSLVGYFRSASLDDFVSTVLSVSNGKVEIASSSTSKSSPIQRIKSQTSLDLTVRGSSNALITALGHAQLAYPAVMPIHWSARRIVASNALELKLKLIVPEILAPSSNDLSSP